MRTLLVVLAGLLPAAPALAACTVLSGATVYSADGPGEGLEILVDGERISAVGEAVPRQASGEDCAVVELEGRTITPGMVEVSSRIGLVEVDMEKATVDASGSGDPVRAALRVADAYNPRSSLIPVQRVEGITSAVTHPSGGRIAGQGAWVDLSGSSQAQAVANPSVGVWASMGGESKAEGLLELREVLEDARFLRRRSAQFDSGSSRELSASRLDLQALYPVLDGKVPLVLGVNRASDIEAVLRFAKEEGILVVLSGAAEGWIVADALAEANVPVIIDPLVYGPGGFDQLHGRADNAKLLHEAGVTVVLSTYETHNMRTLKQVAGNAVRGGLDHDAAVAAITSAPAEVFGMSDYGTLEAGKVANLVVWSGDPLEIGTDVVHVFIEGKDIPLVSRQTELRDRYVTLPGSPVAPLTVE